MAYKRSDINGTTPLDLKNINDNFRNLWYKVFGDIDITDTSTNFQNIINGKTIYVNSSMGLNATTYVFDSYELPDTVWNLIKNNKCIPSINVTGIKPANTYNFVIDYNVYTHVDKDLPSFSVEITGKSGRYVSGVLETIDDVFVTFDINFLI